MGGGTERMRIVPEEMRAAASDIGRLSDEARQVQEILQRSWRRLDYGWQSYARENVDGCFGETLHMLRRMTTMLAQIEDALSKTTNRVGDADRESVTNFDILGAREGSSSLSDDAHRKKMLDTWERMEIDTIREIEMLQKELSGARRLLNKVAGVADDYERLLENARARLNNIQEHIDELSSQSPKMEKGYYEIDSSRYEDSDLLKQKGPTCVAYGALNTLQLRGYNISAKEAKRITKKLDDAGERTLKKTYKVDVAEELIEEYGFEAEIVTYPASGERQATEYLVGQVQSGDPVCVGTGLSYKGELTMGHIMNVVGVELGTDGELLNVKVATNWSSKYETIPGDVFLKEWSDRGYLTVEVNS